MTMMLLKTAIPLPTPESHDEWLSQRRHGIGSSDASTIMGLSAYESPYSLWELKTGKAPLDPPVDERTGELRQWGHLIEPVIREETARRIGTGINKPEHAYAHTQRLWQRTNVDGITFDGAIFEAKNTDSRNAALWSGQIPDHAEIQVHHSAAILGCERAVVAGLVGGNRLVIHEVTINPNIVEMITEAEARFWECVERDIPPAVDAHVRTMESLTREWAHRPGVKEVPVEEAAGPWEAWHQADMDEKDAVERKREALAQITMLLDGHDKLTTGNRVWAAVQRTQINRKRLETDHPDLVAEYMRPKVAFDSAAFKADHPDLYSQYQGVSVRPKTPKGA